MQMVMAVFAYTYHQSFVMAQSCSVEMILEQVKPCTLLLTCFCIYIVVSPFNLDK